MCGDHNVVQIESVRRNIVEDNRTLQRPKERRIWGKDGTTVRGTSPPRPELSPSAGAHDCGLQLRVLEPVLGVLVHVATVLPMASEFRFQVKKISTK